MANNYTQASFCIDVPEGVSIPTLKTVMSLIELLHDVAGAHVDEVDAAIKDFIEKTPILDIPDGVAGLAAIVKEELWELEESYLGFEWALDTESGNSSIWIHGDESVNIESAVECLQVLAIAVPAMQAGAPWYATWANTCSKQRVDEFDGGAVVFDHEHAEWMDAMSWKNQTMENFKTIKAAQSVKPDGG